MKNLLWIVSTILLFGIICVISKTKNNKAPMINSSDEIVNFVKSGRSKIFFLERNFRQLNLSDRSPIFPYKVNYESKIDKIITFCGFPAVGCWALKSDSLFTLFIALKNNSNIPYAISEIFGRKFAQGRVQIKDEFPISSFTYWEYKGESIWLKSMHNFNKSPKYENCYLIIVSDTDYRNIVYLPD